MSDSYLPGKSYTRFRPCLIYLTRTVGAAVLAHSLRDSGTTKKLAVLVTPDSLLYNTITQLKVCQRCLGQRQHADAELDFV